MRVTHDGTEDDGATRSREYYVDEKQSRSYLRGRGQSVTAKVEGERGTIKYCRGDHAAVPVGLYPSAAPLRTGMGVLSMNLKIVVLSPVFSSFCLVCVCVCLARG